MGAIALLSKGVNHQIKIPFKYFGCGFLVLFLGVLYDHLVKKRIRAYRAKPNETGKAIKVLLYCGKQTSAKVCM